MYWLLSWSCRWDSAFVISLLLNASRFLKIDAARLCSQAP